MPLKFGLDASVLINPADEEQLTLMMAMHINRMAKRVITFMSFRFYMVNNRLEKKFLLPNLAFSMAARKQIIVNGYNK